MTSFRTTFVLILAIMAFSGYADHGVGEKPVERTTFKMQLEGLMTLVGSASEKTHMALLAAPGHRPMVEIAAQHRVGAKEVLRLELRHGDVVTFDLTEGKASVTDGYRATVPHLASLIRDGSLRETVLQAQADPSVTAYVHFPSGTLTAGETFPHPAEYRFDDGHFAAKHCVARQILFGTASRRQVVKMTIARTNGVIVERIRSDAVVRVTNLAVSPEFEAHFSMYLSLTDASTIAEIHEDLATMCGSQRLVTRDFQAIREIRPHMPDNPQCTPTDFP